VGEGQTHTEIQMNTSTLAGRNGPSANDQFLLVTSELLERLDDDELLERLDNDELHLGDILTCAEDGRVTGFWRGV
jgi:hypothetical protein